MTPDLLQLASIVSSHPGKRIVGRKRLQKTVYLLQRLGLPTQYDFKLLFYGPYSEGVQADTALLVSSGILGEEEKVGEYGPYYEYTATPDGDRLIGQVQLEPLQQQLQLLSETNAVVLELAATYDAFRQLGYDHTGALEALREEKGRKCDDGRQTQALALLGRLALPTS